MKMLGTVGDSRLELHLHGLTYGVVWLWKQAGLLRTDKFYRKLEFPPSISIISIGCFVARVWKSISTLLEPKSEIIFCIAYECPTIAY